MACEKVYDGGRVREVEVIEHGGRDYAVLGETYQPLVEASEATQKRHGVKRSIKYANKANRER